MIGATQPGPCTVYYLLNKKKQVVYIGMTCRSRNRILEHKRTKDFATVQYFKFGSRSAAAKFERESCELYNPVYNKSLKQKPDRIPINTKLSVEHIKLWHTFALEAKLTKENALEKIIELVTK